MNQNRLNFYNEFFKIIEQVIISYANQEEKSKKAFLKPALNNTTNQEKLIKFISGGIASLLITTSIADEKENLEFIMDLMKKLSK
ncbi:hypothetical protein FP435_07835 [Lactobacillus sp. PV037]|uniref:hypothetical protein n=1 Tax=Lactobacillus sp. PV037 TaxID=2594496 RepID=UPI00223FDD16|nr:hypothetical protein [Lactobacillus sp. PV037]QNQ84334.1 hypothetical protein FP435_07835 [Lactobacillus sp. PV037]